MIIQRVYSVVKMMMRIMEQAIVAIRNKIMIRNHQKFQKELKCLEIQQHQQEEIIKMELRFKLKRITIMKIAKVVQDQIERSIIIG